MKTPTAYRRHMNDDILGTIEVLSNKVGIKEEEANKLKKLVNELRVEAGVALRYPDISDSSAGVSALRSDQFYGQTLTAAIRNYLERRKVANLGAASVGEIYAAIRDGGYKFDTKSEDNAKTSVGNALRKTSSIFHRLPNGQYGLLAWYPNAKAQPEAGTPVKSKGKSGQASKKPATAAGVPKTNGNLVTNKDIRDVILARQGEFQSNDIQTELKEKFPTKELAATRVPTVLFILKKSGLIKEVSPKIGRRGAVYAKI